MTEVKEKNMETKKNSIAEAIHHIATILGFLTAGYYFFQKRTKSFRKVLLSLHMVTQGYGILKIIGDNIDGKKRFLDSFEHVTELCEENETAIRTIPWILLFAAVVFKVGLPALIGNTGK